MTKVLITESPALRSHGIRLNEVDAVRAITQGSGVHPVARYLDRRDIAHPPAPAWYVPATGDIYIHVTEAGIDASKLPSALFVQERNLDSAKAVGLLCHEAAHAAISEGMAVVQKRAPHHGQLLTLLEEIRVENHALRRAPQARRHLRASFTIVLKGATDIDIDNRALVAHAWALVRGRTLAGIATTTETDPIDNVARTLLGDDAVDELTDLLQEAVTLLLPQEGTRMIEICDEWVALVGTGGVDEGCAGSPDGSGAKGSGPSTAIDGGAGAPSGEGGDKAAKGSGGAEGEEPSSGGSGDGESDEDGDSTGIGRPGVEATDHGDPEEGTPEEQPISEEAKELAEATIKDLSEILDEEWQNPDPGGLLANAGEWSARVFGNNRTYKSLEYREPTAAMRQDVVKVSAVLSNLALPAVAKSVRPRLLPPGRMRSREAVRASAERAQGAMMTAQPWKGTVRRHATARPLVMGIATDTSGSMSWAADAVAEFAYVYANAGHRIGARTAAVTFGSHVFRIARPGEVMNKVVFKRANDGEEQCDYALAALDGVLHLTTPSYAARILLVVSDGALVRGGESAKVSEWLKRMDAVGTHVLWITDHNPMGSFWLNGMAKRLDNLTVIPMRESEYSYSDVGFEQLNAAALAAIAKHVR